MAQSFIKPTSANHFEAVYEAPFAGMNTSKDPSDIGPNEFVDATGIVIQSDVLTTAALQNFRLNYQSFFTLYPFTPNGNERIVSIFNCAGFLCAIDQYLNTYIYSQRDTQNGFNQDQVAPGGIDSSFFVINIIGGLALIGVPGLNPTLYIYYPSISFVTATTIAVGIYAGSIDGYALQLNTNQPLDDPGINNNRVNWSAPYEYTTWNPLDGMSNATGAGFNVISDSIEQLTGFSAHGSVGYIYRPNGLTQLSVTGIAIQPFDFNPVTQGPVGIGCKYGKTLTQYAGTDFFISETGVQTFSSQFEGISQKVWNSIFANIINTSFTGSGGIGNNLNFQQFIPYADYPAYYGQRVPAIVGTICTYNSINIEPKANYSILIPTILNNGDFSITNWFFDIESKSWYRTIIPSLATFITANSSYNAVSVEDVIVDVNYFTESLALWDPLNNVFVPNTTNFVKEACYVIQVTFFDSVSAQFQVKSFLLFNNTSAVRYPTYNISNPVPFNLVFKQEQTKVGRNVSIVDIIIRAAGFGTIQPVINGVISQNGSNDAPQVISALGTTITINSTSVGTYTSAVVFTGENPQLVLESNAFDGVIVKAMITGTYADGDMG